MNAAPVPFLSLDRAIREQRAELDAALSRVLTSGWVLLGPELEAFESEWAAWCEAGFAAGVSNGLDALQLILRAWGIGPGDEVIVPSNTYIASWLAVTNVGATPIPVEPEPASCLLDPARIEAAITPRTRAVMPVHLYGHPCDLAPLCEVAHRHGLKVIEDAAQAHGARYHGRRVGGHGDAVAWSFYPSKNLGALADAGAVTSDDGRLIEQIRLLRNYGSRVRYVNEVAGFNNRLEEMQAAILRVKLQVLDAWNGRRAEMAARYQAAFAGTALTLPTVAPGCEHAWHLYTVRHPRRDQLQKILAEEGIGTLIHYPIPPHLQGAYQSLGHPAGKFPISEAIHREILSLPLHPHLATEEQSRVISAVRRALQVLAS